MGEATTGNEVGVKVVHRILLCLCPVLHVVAHMEDGVGVATCVWIVSGLEMNALHLTVYIHGSAQGGYEHVVPLAKLGECGCVFHFQPVDAG